MSCYKIKVLKLLSAEHMGNYFFLFIIKIFKVIAVCVRPQHLLEYRIFRTFTMILIAIVLLKIIRLSWVHGLVMYNMCYTIYLCTS